MTRTSNKTSLYRWLTTAIVAGLIVFQASTAKATPFTPYFEGLINELQSRSAALSNSTDKVEQKQFKACQKALKTFNGKHSTSLATDLKNAGKVAKTLAKAFPEEFNPAPTVAAVTPLTTTSLFDLLNNAYNSIFGDASDILDEIETVLAGLPSSSCKDSAIGIVANIQAILDEAGTAPDFDTAVKTLGDGLKTVAKANAALLKAADCNSGGGGSVPKGLNCSINGNSFSALAAIGNYVNITKQFSVTGATTERAVTVIAVGVTGPGTYPIESGSQVQEITSGEMWAGNVSGTITLTTLDVAAGKATGTFSFTVTKSLPEVSTNEVSVTNGKINITKIIAF
jgi:hypothetical protein